MDLSISKRFSKKYLDSWNNKDYKIKYFGNDLDVIILGETHYSEDILNKQLELIHLVKPDFVLHEFLTALVYNPQTARFEQQPDRILNWFDQEIDFVEISKDLIKASKELHFEIVGCDLSLAEQLIIARQLAEDNPHEYEFDEEFECLVKPSDPDWIFTPLSDVIIPYREQQMLETINSYKRKSEKSVLIILGDLHAKNLHNQKLIQKNRIGYAYVNQTEKK